MFILLGHQTVFRAKSITCHQLSIYPFFRTSPLFSYARTSSISASWPSKVSLGDVTLAGINLQLYHRTSIHDMPSSCHSQHTKNMTLNNTTGPVACWISEVTSYPKCDPHSIKMQQTICGSGKKHNRFQSCEHHLHTWIDGKTTSSDLFLIYRGVSGCQLHLKNVGDITEIIGNRNQFPTVRIAL